jgi:hypothetical protein
MILFIVQVSIDRGTTAKIKDHFNISFGYDMLIMKAGKPLDLPERMNYILKMRRLWYVKVTLQISWQLIPEDMQWVASPLDEADDLSDACHELRKMLYQM